MKLKSILFLLIIISGIVSCGGGSSDKEEAKIPEFKPIEDTRTDASAPQKIDGGYSFAIKAPKAKYVSLVGDFNNWLDNRTPMEKNKNGVWSVTIPLKRGIYSYKFNIDNIWVIDAKNPVAAKDKMGDRRSIIEVKEDTAFYKDPIYLGDTDSRSPVISKDGVRFTYKDKFAKTVSVAGSFNDWEKEQFYLKKNKHGVWSTYIQIPQGKYYYKYSVDDIWKYDPKNIEKADDGQGDYKSVLNIKHDIEDRPSKPRVINHDIVRFSFYNKDLPSNYEISVIGSFNNWETNRNLMVDNNYDNIWFTIIDLKEGEYYYKFSLAGKDFFDQENKLKKFTPEEKEANYIKVILPPGKKFVKFSYDNHKAKNVFLIGDFNDWNPEIDKMERDHSGLWYIVKKLNKGKYSYQFIVDGKWVLDPSNPSAVHDMNGDFNSLCEVEY